MTGTVNGKVYDERRVRVEGEWYTLANNKDGAQANDSDLYTISGSRTDFVNRDEITLYVVGGIAYYAEAARGNDVNRSVLMVYETQVNADEWDNHDQVKAIFPNGNKATITLDKVNSRDITSTWTSDDATKEGALYSYTVNNDDEYILTAISEDNTAGYEEAVADTNGIEDEDTYGGEAIADDAIVFAMTKDGGAKVYSGKTIIDAKLTARETDSPYGYALQEDDNGFIYTRMMNIWLDVDVDTNTEYGYLVSDAVWSYNEELGRWVMEYEYWDGEQVVSKIEETSANKEDWAVKHAIIAYTVDGENITDVTPADVDYAALIGNSNGRVSLVSAIDHDKVVANVDSDTLTYYVKSHASNNDDIGQTGVDGWNFIAKMYRGNENVRYVNAAYILDNDGKDVKFMVIDTDSELQAPANDMYDVVGETVTINADNYAEINANGLTSAQLVAEIKDAANKAVSRIIVKGNATLADELNVPAGKALVFEGTLNLEDSAEINGDITVEDVAVKSGDTAILNGNMTITGEQDAAKLDGLEGTAGSEIEFEVGADGTPAAGTFYEGVQAGAQELTAIASGIYTWTEGVEDVKTGTFDDAWLKSAELGDTYEIDGNVDTADLAALFDHFTTVIADDLTATNSDDAVIPAGKTLQLTDATNTSGVLNTNLTGENATAKLVLDEATSKVNGNYWFFGGNADSATEMLDSTGIVGNVPAGTYVNITGGWLLTTPMKNDITFTSAPSNQDIANAFYATSGKVTVDVALTDIVKIPTGKTLYVNKAVGTGRIIGEADTTVVVNSDISLAKIIAETIDATKVTTFANLGAVSTSGNVKFVEVGTVTYASTTAGAGFYDYPGEECADAQMTSGTYEFNADADNAGNAGFVLVIE